MFLMHRGERLNDESVKINQNRVEDFFNFYCDTHTRTILHLSFAIKLCPRESILRTSCIHCVSALTDENENRSRYKCVKHLLPVFALKALIEYFVEM